MLFVLYLYKFIYSIIDEILFIIYYHYKLSQEFIFTSLDNVDMSVDDNSMRRALPYTGTFYFYPIIYPKEKVLFNIERKDRLYNEQLKRDILYGLSPDKIKNYEKYMKDCIKNIFKQDTNDLLNVIIKETYKFIWYLHFREEEPNDEDYELLKHAFDSTRKYSLLYYPFNSKFKYRRKYLQLYDKYIEIIKNMRKNKNKVSDDKKTLTDNCFDYMSDELICNYFIHNMNTGLILSSFLLQFIVFFNKNRSFSLNTEIEKYNYIFEFFRYVDIKLSTCVMKTKFDPLIPINAIEMIDVNYMMKNKKYWNDPHIFNPMRYYNVNRMCPFLNDNNDNDNLIKSQYGSFYHKNINDLIPNGLIEQLGWNRFGFGYSRCPAESLILYFMKTTMEYLINVNYETKIDYDLPKIEYSFFLSSYKTSLELL